MCVILFFYFFMFLFVTQSCHILGINSLVVNNFIENYVFGYHNLEEEKANKKM